MKHMVATMMVAMMMGAAAQAATETWTTADQYGDFTIVVSAQATPSEQTAATEVQQYWQEVTGHKLAIASAPSAGPNIWVGPEGIPAEYLGGVDPAQFGRQEIWVKTLTAKGQPQLLLLGGVDDGTLYAAYQFIEDHLGVRWLAPGEAYIPKAPTSIAAIDYRYEPIFEYRYSTYFSKFEDADALNAYRQVHRWRPGPAFSCHTFYRFVPPEKYGKEHPEYFALVNGKRAVPQFDYHDIYEREKHPGEVGQLCMTNPGTLQAIMAQLREDIKANPSEKVHHISQMDWGGNCECDQCKAIDEEEGTPMGSVLYGLNQVADMLAKEYPGHSIETLAYTYTRKPPKHMVPRPNVIIKLCSIECDFFRPFNDPSSERNKAFYNDVIAWSKIAPRLHVWDYLTNFRNFQSAMPNFQVIQPNMQFLAEHKVRGMFPQGAYDEFAEFAPLRAYLLSEMLWNPYIDFEKTKNEFIDLYYQEAAPYVKAYIALLTDKVRSDQATLSCFDNAPWYDAATVAKAREIFDQAFAAVKSDTVKHRLDLVYATVQYAALTCPPDLEIKGDTITARRPESQTLDEYYNMLMGYGVKNICDFLPNKEFLRQMNNQTPPRFKQSPLVTLENERYLVWVAPGLEGSVLRWRDKELNVELLRGYETYGRGSGMWQDWIFTPGQAERAVAEEYEVISQSPHECVLRATLPSGVTLDKRLSVQPGSDTVDIALTFTNGTDTAVAPGAKIHPEFYLQGANRPEFWAESGDKWTELTKDLRPDAAVFGDLIPVKDYTKLAFRVPQKRLTVFADFGGDSSVAWLLYFFSTNPDAEHANLELIPGKEPLAPGATLTVSAKYGATRKKPSKL